MNRFVFATVIAFLFPVFGALAQNPDERPDFEVDSLEIVTSGGERHAFTVELAVTPEERGYGLMFVRKLADDQGMLFDYKRNTRASMWMKNTYVPLDMLFIEKDGTIESIIERTAPLSLQSRSAKGRVRAVLELKGGTTSALGISSGDKVIHPIFQ